jgi:L-alanine-DL-glutamate epimerase-like enolase superfamily enzyme
VKITGIEVVRNARPIPLAGSWRPAWNEPDTPPTESFGFGFYRVHTDEGITGIGPVGSESESEAAAATAQRSLVGRDPAYVGKFFETHMRGHGPALGRPVFSGIEIALWDILGKAAGRPVFKLLGACRDRVPAYAATAQLHSPQRAVALAKDIQARGFRALKLRLHRPNPADDVRVVQAVREAVGPDMRILVDANQNHTSWNYENWSRRTARIVAQQLEELDVYWLEEPLPRADMEGLAELRQLVDVNIAGAEHAANVDEFAQALAGGAYDILQPDVILGNIGITGIRYTAIQAQAHGVLIAPHVCGNGTMGLLLAATLQGLGTVINCPVVEYPFDPPGLSNEALQALITEPIVIDDDGCLPIPDSPGIGVDINEDFVAEHS